MGRGARLVNFFGAFAVILSLGAARSRASESPSGGQPDARAADAKPDARPEPRAETKPDAKAGAKPASGSAADAPIQHRARFAILPFANAGGPRTLDFLQAGLPALVAERLARHGGLRFTGPETIVERARLDDALARAAATGTEFVVAGRYEKKPNWKIAVTVEVYAGATPANRVGVGEAEGSKDDVVRTALTAALAAFERAGLPAAPEARARVLEPFARDAYAFVLYGRGIAIYTGLDQPWDPVTGGVPGRGAKAPKRRPPSKLSSPAAVNAYVERALVPLGKSLLIDPRVPETRRFVGLVHLAAGRPGHARAMWSYAADVRPDYAAAVLGLAMLDRTQGLPEARDRYARLLDLDPDDLDARRTYGELLSDAGRLEEAQKQLARVVAAAPSDLRARRALALVLAARRAGNELTQELAEIVRLDPEDLDARLELGAAYASVGNVDAAISTYEEVLHRRPKNTVALKVAADLYRTKGDPAKAATYYEKLRRMAPEDPRPWFLLGTSYYEAGRLDAAERMFTEGARFPGMLGDAYSNLGAIALRRGNQKEALWFLSRAATRRPGKAGVRYNYALALTAAQRYDEALREITAATGAAPQDAEIRFFSGVVALRMGRLADAATAFQETLRLDPNHENARHNLSLIESLRPSEGSFTLH
jgi:tetratricopeptide (TPR) repeat protein